MSALAATLQGFFTDRLIRQRQASGNTITAYRDAVKLLLTFAAQQTGKPAYALDIADLDAPLIGAFLQHLELERGNSVRTRNARLAAIHALFRYAALQHPEHAAIIHGCWRSHPNASTRTLITYLTEAEIDALLVAPDRATWTGRRDHAAADVGLPNRAARQRTDPTGHHATCTSASVRTSAASARAASSGSPRSPPATVACSRAWLTERGGQPLTRCSRPDAAPR